MHTPRLGERERLTNTTSDSLAQRQVEALDRVSQSTTFGTADMLISRNDGKVGVVKIGVNQHVAVGWGQPLPELATRFGAPVANHHRQDLSALKGNRYPNPCLLAFSPDEGPEFI